MLLGVDVGGTFTDAVLAFDGQLTTAKAPTTPNDQSESVIAAVEAVLERAGRRADEVEEFSHGMTVATNALLEGRGAPVALLHSYRHPEHECALGDALAAALPALHISLSHEVVGTFREYERAATTEIDAALSPLLARYLRRLAKRCEEHDLPRPAIMQS